MINAMQQDDDSKLDQTCVLISKDELQFAPNVTVNLKTNEVHSFPSRFFHSGCC